MRSGRTLAATTLTLFVIAASAIAVLPRTARAQADAGAAPMPKVTLDVRDVPVREALEKLFAQANVDYTLDNRVGMPVTMRVVNQPLDAVLRAVLLASGMPLTYTSEGGVYIVRPMSDASIGIREDNVRLSITESAPGEQRVTMRSLNDLPLRDALRLLFQKAGFPYIIGTGVEGKITVSFADAPFETALRYLSLASTPPLTFTRENGVYIVRSTIPPLGLAAAPTTSPDLTLTALEIQLASVKADRAAAVARYSETHPDIRAMDNRIEALTKAVSERRKTAPTVQ